MTQDDGPSDGPTTPGTGSAEQAAVSATPDPDAPSQELPDPAARATQPQRTHPLSILVQGMRTAPIIGVGYLLIVNDQGRSLIAMALLGLPLIVAIIVGGASLRWSRTWYFFDESGDFRLDSGVLQRSQRRLALSRLQSVDVVRPFVARLFGMASVRVEVAGASDSVAVVEYLPDAAAEELRAEVLSRASGAGTSTAPPSAQAEDVRLQVATSDLVTSLLLRGSTVLAFLLTVLGIIGVWTVLGPAGFLVAGFGVVVPVVSVLTEFTTFYNFTLARSPNGLRLRHGLLSTVAQTLPPGRIHALEFSQPILWRRRDWVRVSLNVAGSRSEGDGSATAPRVLVPVATMAEARELVAMILPNWDAEQIPLNPAAPNARLRAPIQHDRLSYGQGSEVLVTTRGRFVRRTAVIAHARVQSLRVIQGPVQRRLGLATMRADTVPGPVSVAARHLPVEQARILADDEAGRMRRAAQQGGHDRWLEGESSDGNGLWAAPDPEERFVAAAEQPAAPSQAPPPPDPAQRLPEPPDPPTTQAP